MFARQQKQQRLLDGLRQLPVTLQTMLELYYWEQVTAPELAAIFHLPENTVRSRIRRGRQLLAAHINQGTSVSVGSPDFDVWIRSVRNASGLLAKS